jgi:hypothetical protein
MKRVLIAIGVFCVGTTSTAIPQSVNPGAGPISVTRATCNGATSVSVTTSYAPPQGSIWVFTNLGSRKVIATVDQPTPLAASTFQFSVGSYLLHSGKHNMWGLTRGRARKMLGAT